MKNIKNKKRLLTMDVCTIIKSDILEEFKKNTKNEEYMKLIEEVLDEVLGLSKSGKKEENKSHIKTGKRVSKRSSLPKLVKHLEASEKAKKSVFVFEGTEWVMIDGRNKIVTGKLNKAFMIKALTKKDKEYCKGQGWMLLN